MNINNYKSGKWEKGYEYKYFLPEKINHSFSISDPQLHKKLEKVSFRLGELNSFSKIVPDIDLFIQSHVMKEAVTSSRIEGTKTDMEQAFTDEINVNPENRDDWMEVNQYVKAMNYALEQLKKLPLSNRLLKNTHKILLSNVRGKHKNPGNFRRSQNWIGGTSLKDAFFIPPSAEHVDDLMSDLEMFLNNREIRIPHLIKTAIAHYQFETIHPFLDGNGRIGRLLITLYLVNAGLLDKPLLYTSDYFEKNRILYYDKLSFTREKNDLSGWIAFFLEAVENTAEKSIGNLGKILLLKDRLTTESLPALGKKAKNAQIFLRILFSHPVVSARFVEKEVGLSPKASNDMIRDFIRIGVLKEITGYKRNRLFTFEPYFNILRK